MGSCRKARDILHIPHLRRRCSNSQTTRVLCGSIPRRMTNGFKRALSGSSKTREASRKKREVNSNTRRVLNGNSKTGELRSSKKN